MDHAMVWITQNGSMYYDFFQTTTKTQTLVVQAGDQAINHKYFFKKPPLNSNDNSFLYIYVI